MRMTGCTSLDRMSLRFYGSLKRTKGGGGDATGGKADNREFVNNRERIKELTIKNLFKNGMTSEWILLKK